MGKLGPAKYRIMVAILASCYILSILAILCCIFYFSGGFLVVQIINLAIGCLGLFSLYREHDVLMKVYGIITIIAAVVQVLLLVAVIVASCYREALTDEALKDLMVHYYLSDDDRETVDAIQEAVFDLNNLFENKCKSYFITKSKSTNVAGVGHSWSGP
ncbi:hypothetical protein Bhyg_08567 [Pseudolycoriella hygida]|uniref:Tetraspanin n=1 Tax=Pseudolycoriella hygida TaxID=35572 RepID=A0A9Q0S3Q2_9DIPT|nr:hypothetical protein Bhyg_08567 [Pseudolycoriella hygida]